MPYTAEQSEKWTELDNVVRSMFGWDSIEGHGLEGLEEEIEQRLSDQAAKLALMQTLKRQFAAVSEAWTALSDGEDAGDFDALFTVYETAVAGLSGPAET